jgi:hypothetical protein
MNLFKNGNRTHDMLRLCIGTKLLFLKFSIEHMSKSVNWNQTYVQEWESNPKNCLSGNRTHELVKSVK